MPKIQRRKRRTEPEPARVMVDELVVWPNAWGPFLKGSCHLTCEDLERLHEFAQRIGLKREWFQDKGIPELAHYDLTAGKRAQALAKGAVYVPAMEQARFELYRIRRRNAKNQTSEGES